MDGELSRRRLLTAGKIPEAERALARSISIKPGYAALTNLGEVKYLSGRYAEAVALQRRAVQLDPSDHTTWGNLGQALLAEPATAAQAPEAFREAVDRVQRYIEIKSDDAKAIAALAWYRANLHQPDMARQLLARSVALGGEPGEVALYNAQTLALLGEFERARLRLAAARSAGSRVQIKGNPVLVASTDGRALDTSTTHALARAAATGPHEENEMVSKMKQARTTVQVPLDGGQFSRSGSRSLQFEGRAGPRPNLTEMS